MDTRIQDFLNSYSPCFTLNLNREEAPYCYVTKWSDRDPGDPWAIGFLQCVSKGNHEGQGVRYRLHDDGRHYRHCLQINKAQGDYLLSILPSLERSEWSEEKKLEIDARLAELGETAGSKI